MHFKFSPDILSRLGEELIPNPDQGIMELVKNSYDADATDCTVKLINTEEVGGTLVVSDNGVGMDQDAIDQGWLVIGRSKKADRLPTSLGRLPVGDKGLGRLAALRQGSKVTLKTRSTAKPGIEYQLSIDWEDFRQAQLVEAVTLQIQEQETSQSPGTDTIIENLKFKLGQREIQRLARELLLLSDPFDTTVSFRPKLIAPGFEKLEKRVAEAYFEDAEYHLIALLHANGQAEAKLMDWKGEELYCASHQDLIKTGDFYPGIAAKLEVWIFGLSSQTFSRRERTATVTEIRDWLKIVGGVHFYYRGLRVKPYGDSGNDWLNLNLARAKAAEDRPSTNTLIGRLIVDDPDEILIQKTDRLGFIENEAFLELRRFAIAAFDWVAKERLKTSEQKREEGKRNIDEEVAAAQAEVRQVIAALEIPQASRTKVLKSIENYEKAKDRATKSLQEDVQLYRTLATTGTIAAVFAHESGKPITIVERSTNQIEKKGQKLLGEKYLEALGEPVKKVYAAVKSLKNFTKLPIELLKRFKRRSSVVNVHSVIDDVINLFKPFLEESKIEVHIHLAAEGTVLIDCPPGSLLLETLDQLNILIFYVLNSRKNAP